MVVAVAAAVVARTDSRMPSSEKIRFVVVAGNLPVVGSLSAGVAGSLSAEAAGSLSVEVVGNLSAEAVGNLSAEVAGSQFVAVQIQFAVAGTVAPVG